MLNSFINIIHKKPGLFICSLFVTWLSNHLSEQTAADALPKVNTAKVLLSGILQAGV